METKIKENGEVVKLKNDGSESKQKPRLSLRLVKHGYNVSDPNYEISLKWGDPYKDDKVIIRNEKAFFLLEKGTEKRDVLKWSIKEAIENGTVTSDNVREFVKEPPPKEREVDPKDYVDKDDFEVVKISERYYINSKFGPSHLYFSELPQGWKLLPKGDAAITRAVKKENQYWEMKIYNSFNKREHAGVLAPAKIIDQKKEELGGEEGIKKRAESKKKGQEKREANITKKLEKAIKSLFPNIPEQALKLILSHTREGKRVGRRQDLYFDLNSVVTEETAFLAVQAHIRHTYTDYDNLFDELSTDEDVRKFRRHVRPQVDKKLEEWR